MQYCTSTYYYYDPLAWNRNAMQPGSSPDFIRSWAPPATYEQRSARGFQEGPVPWEREAARVFIMWLLRGYLTHEMTFFRERRPSATCLGRSAIGEYNQAERVSCLPPQKINKNH